MEIICYLSNGYPTIEASYNMAMDMQMPGCENDGGRFPVQKSISGECYIA